MKVYVKSTCITCKRTVSELERIKGDFEKRDFFKDPFSESELKKIIKLSGKPPKDFLRKRDKKYKEMGLENRKIGDSDLIKMMVENPGLIQRPIIISKGKVKVGKVAHKEDI